MKNILLIPGLFILLAVAVSACNDVIGLDDNINKKMTNLQELQEDTLNKLKYYRVYFTPASKYETKSFGGDFLYNTSDHDTITIYSITYKNPDGIFLYYFPEDALSTDPPQLASPVLPYILYPKKGLNMGVTFHKNTAGNYATGMYYDTLFINNNPKFYITIQASLTQ